MTQTGYGIHALLKKWPATSGDAFINKVGFLCAFVFEEGGKVLFSPVLDLYIQPDE